MKKLKAKLQSTKVKIKNWLIASEKGSQLFLFYKQKKFLQKYEQFPIAENKIVFTNYMGKGYGCNCKYIAEELLRQGKHYDLVWIVSNPAEMKGHFPNGIRLVKYHSQEALYEYATAKYWVCNYHLVSFFRRGLVKRPGQIYIQIWHGSLGIKKIENDVQLLTADKLWLILARLNSQSTDYWISDSTFETQIYKQAFWDVKNVLELGHPRNDIFFRSTDAINEKVHNALGIEPEKRILLYIPTFREDYRWYCYGVDFERSLQVLHEKFGSEWVCITRMHPRIRKMAKQLVPISEHIFDATYYDDVQELLAAADVVISDYSSCIFDFMSKR